MRPNVYELWETGRPTYVVNLVGRVGNETQVAAQEAKTGWDAGDASLWVLRLLVHVCEDTVVDDTLPAEARH